MKGKHRIIVSTKRLKYDFEIRRNLTVIRGDSATGKTTLVDMIREYVNNPSGTPVELTCDKKCYVLEGSLWKEQLSAMQDSIVFIDEGNEFIKTVPGNPCLLCRIAWRKSMEFVLQENTEH